MNSFDGPGQGRKQCPQCLKYVGGKSSHCVCGHAFVPKPEEPKEIKTYKEGGTGRKQCPACELYVAARTALCACGASFAKGKEVPTPIPAPIRQSDTPKVEVEAPTTFTEEYVSQLMKHVDTSMYTYTHIGGAYPHIVQLKHLLKESYDAALAAGEKKTYEEASGGHNLTICHFTHGRSYA